MCFCLQLADLVRWPSLLGAAVGVRLRGKVICWNPLVVAGAQALLGGCCLWVGGAREQALCSGARVLTATEAQTAHLRILSRALFAGLDLPETHWTSGMAFASPIS